MKRMELLAWCGHPLKEHLLGSRLIIENVALYRYATFVNIKLLKNEVKGVSSRIARLLSISEDRAKRLAAIAACVHDIGKAHPKYQKMFRLCSRQERFISLVGHEMLSAWAVARSLSHVRGFSRKEAYVIAAAVALHHSARRSILEAYYEIASRIPAPFDNLFLQSASQLLSMCLDGDGDLTSRLLYILRFYAQRPYPILSLIEELANMEKNEVIASELLTYLVSLADNIDSHMYRRGFQTMVIKRFLRIK